MEPCRHRVPQGGFIIVLLGPHVDLGDMVRGITESDRLCPVASDCLLAESGAVRVVGAADVFNPDDRYHDQHVIDCMALSLPGPHVFILAVGRDHARAEEVTTWLETLWTVFGNVSQNLVVLLPHDESRKSLGHLQKRFNVVLTVANGNLATECKEWCVGRKPFVYHYNDYSEAAVRRRRDVLSRPRRHDPPVCDGPASASAPRPGSTEPLRPDAPATKQETFVDKQKFFNIILLGLTGTGKSASANTILSAARSKTRFASFSNSEPVTLKCQSETVGLFGTPLTVVDTPDFFHENIRNSREELNECKKYFVPGHYAVFLLVKVNRFTDEERDILEKLERKLETNIRDETVLLFTCGEELKGKLCDFIRRNPELDKVAKQCLYRFHLFQNKRNKPEQVQSLIKKFPQFYNFFPKVDLGKWLSRLLKDS